MPCAVCARAKVLCAVYALRQRDGRNSACAFGHCCGNGNGLLSPRWIALKLLERNETLNARICEYTKTDFSADERIEQLISQTNGKEFLEEEVGTVVARAEQIAALCLHSPPNADRRDRRADRILTSPLTVFPLCLRFFALILWITVVGANYPSELLFRGFAFLGEKFRGLLQAISAPPAVVGCVTDGIYLTLTWWFL